MSRVTGWSFGEEPVEYRRAERRRGQPWHAQPLGDVVGVQEHLATPIAAKPDESQGPQCQARTSGPAVASALPSSPAQAVTTWSTSCGELSERTARSKGR